MTVLRYLNLERTSSLLISSVLDESSALSKSYNRHCADFGECQSIGILFYWRQWLEHWGSFKLFTWIERRQDWASRISDEIAHIDPEAAILVPPSPVNISPSTFRRLVSRSFAFVTFTVDMETCHGKSHVAICGVSPVAGPGRQRWRVCRRMSNASVDDDMSAHDGSLHWSSSRSLSVVNLWFVSSSSSASSSPVTRLPSFHLHKLCPVIIFFVTCVMHRVLVSSMSLARDRSFRRSQEKSCSSRSVSVHKIWSKYGRACRALP